jgi:Zn-dependent M28 family amino/carboxypeptidase
MLERTSAVLIPLALLVGGWSQSRAPRASTLFDAPQLLRDLQSLSSDDMQGRQVGTPGGEKARAYVVDRFKAAGLQPVGDAFTHPFTFKTRAGADVQGVNVVGRIDGTRDPRRYVVVSAHYDHIGVRNGVVNNGADDNASGTAALFTLAKYFSTHRPAHSLLFVAFDGEEAGLQGARAFVASPPVDASAIVVDLNMDMIGRDPDDKLFVVGTRLQPQLKPFIDRIAAGAPVKLLTGHEDPTEKEDWTRDSDHYAFMSARIPALYFGVEDFDQHHKPTDDYETMTLDFYVRAVETLIKAVQDFDAHLDELPRRS